MKKELSSRQWDLYKFFKENYKEGFYITKAEIVLSFPQYYKPESYNPRGNYRIVEDDIRKINDYTLDQNVNMKPIISNKIGYKIGNEIETEKYIKNRFINHLRYLKKDYMYARKLGMHNQMRLVFGSEKDTMKAFMEESINDGN